jgi:hypothetical protein
MMDAPVGLPEMSKLLRSFALGPGFWTRVAVAEAKDPLEQSSWERGLAMVASQYESPRSPVWAVQAVLAGAAGVPIGNAVAVSSWGVQVLVGGAAGLFVFWALPVALAGALAARPAPTRQRNEARKYAQALEAYAHDYTQWARRREIAYDFRHDTLEDARRLSGEVQGGPLVMGSVADEEIRWRTILTNIGAQIEANGGEVSAFMQAQLAFLDNADGSFEGDDIARIRNSMLTACQNLLAEIRQEGPPTPPTRPSSASRGRAFQ